MSSPPPVSRPVAMFLPPIIALLLAAVYTQWQAHLAQGLASSLCAQFKAGDSVLAFKQAAAAHGDLELNESDAPVPTITASKTVYQLKRESYRCSVTHDGAKILSLDTRVDIE
jgi:hypothetical protein